MKDDYVKDNIMLIFEIENFECLLNKQLSMTTIKSSIISLVLISKKDHLFEKMPFSKKP